MVNESLCLSQRDSVFDFNHDGFGIICSLLKLAIVKKKIMIPFHEEKYTRVKEIALTSNVCLKQSIL